MPLYVLGLEGMTRRMQHYDVAGMAALAASSPPVGALLILVGIGCQIAQLVVCIRNREALRDLHRRSLGRPHAGMDHRLAAAGLQFRGPARMSTGEEAYWGIKQKAIEQRRLTDLPEYKPIEMPRNSPTGFVTAFFAVVTGFCADLAHLVDGRRRAASAPSRPSSSSPGATITNMTCPPKSSRGSTTSGGRRASPLSKAASPASRRVRIISRRSTIRTSSARRDAGRRP